MIAFWTHVLPFVVLISFGTTGIEALDLGTSCLFDFQCNGVNTFCNNTAGICECQVGLMQVSPTSNDCGACVTTNDCWGNSTCQENRCLCNSGFELKTVITDFLTSQNTCEETKCPVLTPPDNGFIEGSGAYQGAQLFFYCSFGHLDSNTPQRVCLNSGEWSGIGTYQCFEDGNECEPNQCQNGATCTDLVNAYLCDCVGGWHGQNCDQECRITSDCGENAFCNDSNGCQCNEGYEFKDFVLPNRQCVKTVCNELMAPIDITLTGSGTFEGATRRYQCPVGKLGPYGQREINRTCLNTGEWSGDAFDDCVVVECGQTPTPGNFSILKSTSGITFGSTSLYECIEGYETQGRLNISCDSNGVWEEPPTCTIKDCGPTPQPGKFSKLNTTMGTKFGSISIYQCIEGYDTSDSLNVSCDSKGVWGPVPNCTIKECGPTPESNNFSRLIETTGTSYGSSSLYECIDGYETSDSLNISCNSNGTWETAPFCTIKECGQTPTPGNFSILNSTSGITFGSTSLYECIEGYETQGRLNISCDSNGDWEGPPTCTIKDCGPTPQLGKFSKLNTTMGTKFGSISIYQCIEGSDTSDSLNVSCDSKGVWGPVPNCTIKECGPTPESNNFSRLIETTGTSYGSSSLYECIDGYETSDSLNISCKSNGTWETAPFCTIKECGQTPTPVNFSILNSTSGITFGSTSLYECIEGYETQGRLNISCDSNGDWEGPPTCTIKDCGPTPQLGKFSKLNTTMGTKFGSIFIYQCIEGYDTSDSLNVSCDSKGVWGPVPNCTIKECGPTPESNNFSRLIETTGTSYGSSSLYECIDGYETSDSLNISCKSNGTWETAPFCTIKECGQTPTPGNFSILNSTSGITFGSTSLYECIEGYETQGRLNISCDSNGDWEGPPTCTIKDCGPTPQLGKFSKLNTTMGTKFGSISIYQCIEGYATSDSLNVSCDSKGVWGPVPNCTIKECGPTPESNNFSRLIETTGTSYGSSSLYECIDGYETSDSLNISCNSNGTWETAPFCTIKECGQTPTPVNFSILNSTSGITFGSTSLYECIEGYETQGRLNISCDSNGDWEGPPTCTIKDCGPTPQPGKFSKLNTTMGTKFGSISIYQCIEGYDTSYSLNVSCDSKGVWGPVPNCTIKECGPTPESNNFSRLIETTGTSYGSSSLYECIDGYETSDSLNISCNSNGTWETAPFCTIKECGQTPTPGNFSILNSTSGITFGSTSLYECIEGYETQGRLNISCESNGDWEGPPTCTIKDCGPTPQPGKFSKLNTTMGTKFGSISIYQCIEGYDTSDSLNVSCDSKGVWGPVPNCTIKECGPTPESNNFSRLIETTGTSYGSSSLYECIDGYETSDSLNISCKSNGTWETAPFCTIKECGQKPTPGNFSILNSTSGITFGSTSLYECIEGYETQGRLNISCDSNGDWEGPPTCTIKDCGPTPQLGKFSKLNTTMGTKFGSISIYQCIEGYDTSDSLNVSCDSKGVWGPVPNCTIKECGPTPESNNFSRLIETTGTSYGSSSLYECIDGYETSDSLNISCNSNGTWEIAPFCTIKECGQTPTPGNFSILNSTSGITFGSTSLYECIEGYETQGRLNISCDSNGDWEGPPTCTIKDCGPTPQPGKFSKLNTTMGTKFGSISIYQCIEGYDTSNSLNVSCDSKGVWGPVPNCTIKECGPTPESNNFSRLIETTGTSYGSSSLYECIDGYETSDSLNISCNSNGTWETAPFCIIKECGQTPTPGNFSILNSTSGITFGSTSLYECIEGYETQGRLNISCDSNGDWEGPPTCTIKDCGPTPQLGKFSKLNTTMGTKFGSISIYQCIEGYVTSDSLNVSCDKCGPTPESNNFSRLIETTGTSYGSSSLYECIDGYETSDSLNISCNSNGTWETAPFCTIKECGQTPTPGNFSILNSTSGITFGSTSLYECIEGYETQGRLNISCDSNGVWEEPPTCTIKDCAAPPDLANGIVIVSPNGTLFGAIRRYRCSRNYVLIGAEMVVCEANGRWGRMPVCKPGCPVLSPPKGGYVEQLDQPYSGTMATFMCQTGFTMDGRNTIVCTKDGKWNGTLPVCYPDCPPFGRVSNGNVSITDGLKYNSIGTVTCNLGYAITGSETSTCSSSGRWTAKVPICQIVCGEIPSPRNGMLVIKNITAVFRCDSGYSIVGDNEILCNISTNLWIGKTPSCLKDCGIPPAIPNGSVIGPQQPYVGQTITIECNPGFTRVGGSGAEHQCLPNGKYRPPIDSVSCKSTCTKRVNPENGEVISDGNLEGDTALYNCNPGYVLVGTPEIQCTDTGNWSDTPPTCTNHSFPESFVTDPVISFIMLSRTTRRANVTAVKSAIQRNWTSSNNNTVGPAEVSTISVMDIGDGVFEVEIRLQRRRLNDSIITDIGKVFRERLKDTNSSISVDNSTLTIVETPMFHLGNASVDIDSSCFWYKYRETCVERGLCIYQQHKPKCLCEETVCRVGGVSGGGIITIISLSGLASLAIMTMCLAGCHHYHGFHGQRFITQLDESVSEASFNKSSFPSILPRFHAADPIETITTITTGPLNDSMFSSLYDSAYGSTSLHDSAYTVLSPVEPLETVDEVEEIHGVIHL